MPLLHLCRLTARMRFEGSSHTVMLAFSNTTLQTNCKGTRLCSFCLSGTFYSYFLRPSLSTIAR